MKITVIGCGRWGSFIAYYLSSIGNDVTVYGRVTSPEMQRFITSGENGMVRFPDTIKLSYDLKSSLEAEVTVISINSQGLRSLLAEIDAHRPVNKTFILCMKGLEIGTGMRLSQITKELTSPTNRIAVWLGPGHVQEFLRGTPNCMVIDSEDEYLKTDLADAFSSDLIRFYYGQDLVGNEIGAAAKNVIGIAAGMLDGLNRSALKGALLARGTHEIANLIEAMGGNPLSAYGLCHLGDYEATVFSKFSHNRQYGESFVLGQPFTQLAEGCHTVRAMMQLCEQYKTSLPICTAVNDVLYHAQSAEQTLNALFARRRTNEF